MPDSLYPYYERELRFLRREAQEFARRYPTTAGQLLLGADQAADPHVERMIEAVALLAARVHKKVDDELPELTDAILTILYPHYLNPIPSLALVELAPDFEAADLKNGYQIPRNHPFRTLAVGDVSCRFRSTAATTLWPIQVTHASLVPPPFSVAARPPRDAVALLRLRLTCQADATFAKLSLERLRFFLFGDAPQVGRLYETIFNQVTSVAFAPVAAGPGVEPALLEPGAALTPGGFEPDEGLLPYPMTAAPGRRLLTEYFAFPAKFSYVDVSGFSQAAKRGFGRELDLCLFLTTYDEELARDLTAENFRLGAVPLVNLFPQTAEPIRLDHTRDGYRVIPDAAREGQLEVHSIDRVRGSTPGTDRVIEYQPLYSIRHGSGTSNGSRFWHSSRHPAGEGANDASEVYLHLVNLDFEPSESSDEAISVETTCSNRDVPALMQRLGRSTRFESEASAPIASIRSLIAPTATIRPPSRRGAYWRLISHLALNHLSIAEEGSGLETLKETLRLYEFLSEPTARGRPVARAILEGMVGLRTRRVVAPVGGLALGGFARGIEIDLELDRQQFVGAGFFLFASVLERYLAQHASLNSFVQMTVRGKGEADPVKRWPPRAGTAVLV